MESWKVGKKVRFDIAQFSDIKSQHGKVDMISQQKWSIANSTKINENNSKCFSFWNRDDFEEGLGYATNLKKIIELVYRVSEL